jgi:hypothetical protein
LIPSITWKLKLRAKDAIHVIENWLSRARTGGAFKPFIVIEVSYELILNDATDLDERNKIVESARWWRSLNSWSLTQNVDRTPSSVSCRVTIKAPVKRINKSEQFISIHHPHSQMAPKGRNMKKEAGRAKKAENETKKKEAAKVEQERKEAAKWVEGARVDKAAEARARQEATAAKKAEIARLLAEEEAQVGSSKVTDP